MSRTLGNNLWLGACMKGLGTPLPYLLCVALVSRKLDSAARCKVIALLLSICYRLLALVVVVVEMAVLTIEWLVVHLFSASD